MMNGNTRMVRWVVLGFIFCRMGIAQAGWTDTKKVVNSKFNNDVYTGWNVPAGYVYHETGSGMPSPCLSIWGDSGGASSTAWQEVTVTPYVNYNVTCDHAFWWYNDPGSDYASLVVTTPAGAVLASRDIYGGDGVNWATFELAFSAGNNTSVKILLVAHGDNYASWFDNIKLFQEGVVSQWNFNAPQTALPGTDYRPFEDIVHDNDGLGYLSATESVYEGAGSLKILNNGCRFYAPANCFSMDEGTYMFAYKSIVGNHPGDGSSLISTHLYGQNNGDTVPVRILYLFGRIGIYGLAGGESEYLTWVDQTLLNDVWHTLAVTYKNGETIKVYIDGTLVAQSNYNYVAAHHSNRNYFVLGNMNVDLATPTNYNFPGYWAGATGYYDNLMYTDAVLSAADILRFHQTGYPPVEPWVTELTRGHRLLVQKGLQLAAMCSPRVNYPLQTVTLHLDTVKSANFTTVFYNNLNIEESSIGLLGAAPGVPWGRITDVSNPSKDFLQSWEFPYLSNLVGMQYYDEQDMTVQSNIAAAKAWLTQVRCRYPETLGYTNQMAEPSSGAGLYTVAQLTNYMINARPDMMMFDLYPFSGQLTGNSPTTFYKLLQRFRQAALAGLDGNGNQPIPYGLWLQAYVDGSNSSSHLISESEIRYSQFSAWTFGYKYADAFVYNDQDAVYITSVLFNGSDDSSPTATYSQMAETNRQSRVLGPALVRLLSTDVRIQMGKHYKSRTWYERVILGRPTWEYNSAPDNITQGLSGVSGSYITSMSCENLGSYNNNLPGDLVIGFFKPLHESFDGSAYSNQQYFMITNGLTEPSASAANTTQSIRVDFDFGASGITTIQRINRFTGQVEVLSLDSDGGSKYHLHLGLGGGEGDLFKYNTGAPFVGWTDL